jgi:UDP-glucuronate decarboxylase
MSLNDGRVYADFIADIVNNKNLTLKSEGAATRAFCYLKDATIGFLTVLLKGTNREAYNIGNPHQEVSIKELATILTSLFPEKKLSLTFEIPATNNQYLTSTLSRNSPDVTKAGALGWRPVTSIQEGFTRTINYFTKK